MSKAGVETAGDTMLLPGEIVSQWEGERLRPIGAIFGAHAGHLQRRLLRSSVAHLQCAPSGARRRLSI